MSIRIGISEQVDADQAIADLARQLGDTDLVGLIFFCSIHYDLPKLARAIHQRFTCPSIGCTTAGEICAAKGYIDNSVVGIGFMAEDIRFHPLFIPSLSSFVDHPQIFDSLLSRLRDPQNCFALLLIDGLTALEDRVVSLIYNQLQNIPLIGGSAGDGLAFERTFIYHQGAFHHNAAALLICETSLPFIPFRIQHFTPTDTKLVITAADGPSRRVLEIDGRPAAETYAAAVGVSLEQLNPQIFAAHPVMLRLGGDYFARSIQKVHPDGSLTFYCAIEEGLVLTLGQPGHLLENLASHLKALSLQLPELQLILGYDCILRRLESAQRNEFSQLQTVLAPYPFVGFSTYGEQFGAVHINHTLTGIALGRYHVGR